MDVIEIKKNYENELNTKLSAEYLGNLSKEFLSITSKSNIEKLKILNTIDIELEAYPLEQRNVFIKSDISIMNKAKTLTKISSVLEKFSKRHADEFLSNPLSVEQKHSYIHTIWSNLPNLKPLLNKDLGVMFTVAMIKEFKNHIKPYPNMSFNNVMNALKEGMSPVDIEITLDRLKQYNSKLKETCHNVSLKELQNLLIVSDKYESAFSRYVNPEVLQEKGFKAMASLDDLKTLVGFDNANKGIAQKPSEIKNKLDVCTGRLQNLNTQLQKNETELDKKAQSMCFCLIPSSKIKKLKTDIFEINSRIKKVTAEHLLLSKVSKITNNLVSAEKQIEKREMSMCK